MSSPPGTLKILGFAIAYVAGLGVAAGLLLPGDVLDYIPGIASLPILAAVVLALLLGHLPLFKTRVPRLLAWVLVGFAFSRFELRPPWTELTTLLDVALCIVLIVTFDLLPTQRQLQKAAFKQTQSYLGLLLVPLVLIAAGGEISLGETYSLILALSALAFFPAPAVTLSALQEHPGREHDLFARHMAWVPIQLTASILVFLLASLSPVIAGFVNILGALFAGLVLGALLSRLQTQSSHVPQGIARSLVLIGIAVVLARSRGWNIFLMASVAGFIHGHGYDLVRHHVPTQHKLRPLLENLFDNPIGTFLITPSAQPLIRLVIVVICVFFGLYYLHIPYYKPWMLGIAFFLCLARASVFYFMTHKLPHEENKPGFSSLASAQFAQGPIALIFFYPASLNLSPNLLQIATAMVVIDLVMGAPLLQRTLRKLSKPEPSEARDEPTDTHTTPSPASAAQDTTVGERRARIVSALEGLRSRTTDPLEPVVEDAQTVQLSRYRHVEKSRGLAQLFRGDQIVDRIYARFRSSTREHASLCAVCNEPELLEALPWLEGDTTHPVELSILAERVAALLEREGEHALRLAEVESPPAVATARPLTARLDAGLRTLLS